MSQHSGVPTRSSGARSSRNFVVLRCRLHIFVDYVLEIGLMSLRRWKMTPPRPTDETAGRGPDSMSPRSRSRVHTAADRFSRCLKSSDIPQHKVHKEHNIVKTSCLRLRAPVGGVLRYTAGSLRAIERRYMARSPNPFRAFLWLSGQYPRKKYIRPVPNVSSY
jgi:hypothetical protein